MNLFLTVLHVVVCLFMIVVVLLQRGKGAEVGAVFGGGASNTVFGSRGAGNFLTRLTTGAAVVFMVTSLSLAYFARQDAGSALFEEEAPPAQEETLPQGAPPPEGAAQGEAPAAGGAAEGGETGADAPGGEGSGTSGAEDGGGLSAAPEEEGEPAGGAPGP